MFVGVEMSTNGGVFLSFVGVLRASVPVNQSTSLPVVVTDDRCSLSITRPPDATFL